MNPFAKQRAIDRASYIIQEITSLSAEFSRTEVRSMLSGILGVMVGSATPTQPSSVHILGRRLGFALRCIASWPMADAQRELTALRRQRAAEARVCDELGRQVDDLRARIDGLERRERVW